MTSPELDLLIVGGGIHGVGVAQAAAAAGYRACLVEKSALAAGTSGKSSKLIHGGLRYLESGRLRLVRESLRERQLLLDIAPHLVRLVPFFIPVYRGSRRPPWQIRAGLTMYAALLGFQRSARFRTWPRARYDELEGLRRDGLRAVYRYLDGQTDDALLCRAVMASAEELGATLRTRTELVRAECRAGGVHAVLRSGDVEEGVSAKVLVNAAGPWVNHVLARVTPECRGLPIDLVAGSHLELAGPTRPGIYYTEAPQDARPVFVMPWKGHTLVGTTERMHHDPPDAVHATREEQQYLETVFRHYFPERDLEILDSWSGLRVLPAGTGSASRRSRETELWLDSATDPRVLAIYGGKLTGYRLTARKVLHRLRPTLGPATPRADTATLRLPDPGAAARAAGTARGDVERSRSL